MRLNWVKHVNLSIKVLHSCEYSKNEKWPINIVLKNLPTLLVYWLLCPKHAVSIMSAAGNQYFSRKQRDSSLCLFERCLFYFCFWQVKICCRQFVIFCSLNVSKTYIRLLHQTRCRDQGFVIINYLFISWNKVKMHCRSHSKMSFMINEDGFMIHMFLFYNKSNQPWLLSKLSLNLLV